MKLSNQRIGLIEEKKTPKHRDYNTYLTFSLICMFLCVSVSHFFNFVALRNRAGCLFENLPIYASSFFCFFSVLEKILHCHFFVFFFLLLLWLKGKILGCKVVKIHTCTCNSLLYIEKDKDIMLWQLFVCLILPLYVHLFPPHNSLPLYFIFYQKVTKILAEINI